MALLVERPFSTVCPKTGSQVFIRNELLDLAKPIAVVCPVCELWHIWNPATLKLSDSAGPASGEACLNSN